MKKINLYNEKGWLNVKGIIDYDYTFNFLIGPRGTGKTYGVLDYLIDSGKKFIYLRRTLKDIELCLLPSTNPFNPINVNKGINIIGDKVSKDVLGFYHSNYDEDTHKYKPTGVPIALAFSLSTVAGVRGLSLEDYDFIYFDEFIPIAGAKKLKNEAVALFDFYETVNRNRELKGLSPVKLIASTNANTINNDLYISLNLVNVIQKLIKNQQDLYIDKDRSLLVANILHSPISEKKKKTSLYKLIEGSDYEKMAISNEYTFDDFSDVHSMNVTGMTPIFKVGNIVMYKTSNDYYYISPFLKGVCKEYDDNSNSYNNIIREHYYVIYAKMKNKIIYENYNIKLDFINKLKLK